MFAGQYGAGAIGAALLPFFGTRYGYQSVYLVKALIILVILLIRFITKEIIKGKAKEKIVSLVIKEFKTRTVLLVTLFSPLVFINEGIKSFIIPIYMRDGLGLSDIQVGFVAMILPFS